MFYDIILRVGIVEGRVPPIHLIEVVGIWVGEEGGLIWRFVVPERGVGKGYVKSTVRHRCSANFA